MWHLSLSILVLAGALMASVGTIMDSLPDVHRRNDLDIFGMIVVGVGIVLFGLETLRLWMKENRGDKS